MPTLNTLIQRAIAPSSVRPDGNLTRPRSFGVYELPASASATRRFRFGNHPVRLAELEREFKRCRLLYLFRVRDDAASVAGLLNSRQP